MAPTLTEQQEEVRFVGRLGFWAVIGLAVILGAHPVGTTKLYASGEQFLEHVNAFWVVLHLASGILMLVLPIIIGVWARHLASTPARVFGQWSTYIGIVGVAVGTIHLIAFDTTLFLAFSDTFAAGTGSEAVTVGADLLLRIHAATLTAWVVSLFFALPAVLGFAAHVDGRFPRWYPWLTWLASVVALASVIVTLAEEQWTTLSEMVLLRTSGVLLIVWLLTTTWWMRRGSIAPVG